MKTLQIRLLKVYWFSNRIDYLNKKLWFHFHLVIISNKIETAKKQYFQMLAVVVLATAGIDNSSIWFETSVMQMKLRSFTKRVGC